MQPLAIDPGVLRTLLAPEIKVVPGRALMARVVLADGSGRGSLSIAGFLLEAELPPDVRTGQDLRLIVRDVSPERVLLSLSEQHQPAPAPALGAVDLRFTLDPNTMTLSVMVPPAALGAARAAAENLRGALVGALGRSVSVTITPRREPVDVYA